MKYSFIRSASLADSLALAKLVQQEAEYSQRLGQNFELQPDINWEAFVHEKLQRGNGQIFLADKGGQLIGFVEIRIAHYPQVQNKPFWLKFLQRKTQSRGSLPIIPISWGVIESCFVMELFRRSGTGKALVEKAMQWFKNKNISRVELSLLANNEQAKIFWQQLGFETYRLLMRK